MDPTSFTKAVLIHAAYQGAGAVCGGIAGDDGKPLPLDPTVQDAGLQKKGVLLYELAKIQYHAILRAFHDQSGVWPDPKVPAGAALDLPALLAKGIGLLGQLPKDASIGTILDLVTKLTGNVAAAKPGQELR